MPQGGTPLQTVEFNVNGALATLAVEPRLLLVEALREKLVLTGTHAGCDTSNCGSCAVLLDGLAIKSCTMFAVQAHGRAITTIEGLGAPDARHPVHEALWDAEGLPCGYCTPGMIVSAVDLLARIPDPTENQIRAALDGNLCRCAAYENIVASVRAAAAKVRAQAPLAP